MADIAVVIVNYNSAALALKAVDSALGQTVPVEVHLVDNASPAGDAAVLAAEIDRRGWGDRVTLHAEAENHGFGRGNNVALRALRERADAPGLVFFLNPDAVAAPDAAARLSACLDAHPRAAVAGAATGDSAGTPQSSAFRDHSLLSVFEAAVNFGPVSRALARWRVPLPPAAQAARVDWVSGAAFMARRGALAAVGDFDPGFFLYFEEADMMRALRRRGHEIWTAPDARVTHDEGGATGVAEGRRARARTPAYWYESWRRYFLKNRGRAYAICAALAWSLGAALGVVIAALRGRRTQAPAMLQRDIWARVIWPLLTGQA